MKPKAFILMPFAPDFDQIYNLFIADALTIAGYDVFRADDIKSNRNIIQDIVTSIISANLIVADLTDANPNVYYELGLAHAFKKHVILITQDIEKLPFDLRPYKVISYDTHFATIQKAREKLIDLAKGANKGIIQFGSPVTDFANEKILKNVQSLELNDEIDDGELGLLDYQVNMEEGLAEITSIITIFAGKTNELTTNTQNFTKEIENASRNKQKGSAKYIQKKALKFSSQIKEFTNYVENANKNYSIALNTIGDSIELIIKNQKDFSKDDKQELLNFLEELAEVEGGAIMGRDAYLGMAETMEGLPVFQKNLHQSIIVAAKEIRQFVGNIDQTIAIVSRARGVGKRFLK